MILRNIRNNPNRYFWSCLGLIVIFSVVSVTTDIDGSLTIDEPFSANLVILPWKEMFEVFLHDPAAPLYYVFLKLWVYVFGDSERAVRSLSVICFAFTVIVVGITTMKIDGIFAGVAGSILASISGIGITFAGTARPYALLSLLTAISTLILFYMVGLIKTNSMSGSRNLILPTGFALINVLGLLTHPIFVFFMLGCNLAAWIRSRKHFLIISLCNILTLGIHLSIWGSFLLHTINLPATNWMEVPDIRDLIHGYLNLWGIGGTILLFLYIALASIWNFQSMREFVLSRSGLIGLCILTATSLLPFLVSQFRPVFDDSRTPELFFPLASVFVALLVTRFKSLKLTFGLLIMMLGFILVVPVFAIGDSRTEYSPRSSIQYVIENAKCGDVFVAGGLSINEISYYMHQLNAPNCIERYVFPESMNDHPGWMDPPGLLQHSDELETEANLLVNDINQSSGNRNNIWFFYESRTPRQKVLDILKNQLDRKMVLIQRVKGYGTFFDSVLVYSEK